MSTDPEQAIFYLIIDSDQAKVDDRFSLLEQSAQERGAEVRPLHPDTLDWSQPPRLEPGSMLYRITIGRRAGVLERFLLHDRVVTFLMDNNFSMRPMGDMAAVMLEQQAGVPPIPTIHNFTSDRDLLESYVDALGGFPIVVKRMGGSRGVGVMRIDSMPSLLSLADVLLEDEDHYIVRKYIPDARHFRLMVLGEAVVSAVEYLSPKSDFRTNAVQTPQVEPWQPGAAASDIAVRTVRCKGFEFGGVDLLQDRDGNYLVAESNFPCYFPRVQNTTGVDISGMMVDYLLRKRDAMLAGG